MPRGVNCTEVEPTLAGLDDLHRVVGWHHHEPLVASHTRQLAETLLPSP